MVSEKTYRILKVIEPGTYSQGVSAKAVACSLWQDDPDHSYLFSACSKQGNGACRGKKAWLCAGSLIGKLRKKGLVDYDRHFTGYVLKASGKAAVREYENYQG